MNLFTMKLGEILTQAGTITQQQLQQALADQKESKLRLGEQLIASGILSESALCRALQTQLHLPYVDLLETAIAPEVASLVPESLARRHDIIPFDTEGHTLKLAIADPLNYTAVRDVEIATGHDVQLFISEKSVITKKIHETYTNKKVLDAAKALSVVPEEAPALLEVSEDEQPIIRFVNNMFEQAVLMNASDIHIEPSDKTMTVRFRVDGKLLNYITTGSEIFPSVCSRIKYIGGMSIAEKRVPQDGRATYHSTRHNIDLRLSTLPGVYGEKIVIRITTALNFTLRKENLGFSAHNIAAFDKLIHKPHGIVLLTGPTGSGKSTTLYTILNEIRSEDTNLITVENPVEMLVPGVTQVNINPAQGLTFASVLRSVLRQDPDVVMIGEIRDEETAEIAASMSITGHFVLSTLHTYDAPSAVVRLVDMGIQPFMVASSVVGVISQRLVRTLCPRCKVAYDASAQEKQLLGADPAEKLTLYRSVGCAQCIHTGFSGRTAIAEIMPVSAGIRAAINAEQSSDELRALALSEGMRAMAADACEAVIAGKTSLQEAMMYIDFE